MEHPSPGPLFHKPLSIVAAKNILYTVMFLALLTWTIDRLSWGSSTVMAVVILVLTLVLLFALTKAFTRGHKWARVVLLVLFLLGLIPYLLGLGVLWNTRLLVAVLSLVQFLLEALAIGFLFRQESTRWFNRVKEAAQREPHSA